MAATDDNKLTRDERNFAEQTRLLREERGMSQSDLAERLRQMGLDHITQATISRIENMSRPVRMIESQALSRVFRRTVAAMTNPNGREFLLTLIDATHSTARKQFVGFRKSIEEFLFAQKRVREDLGELERRFADRDSFDPETQKKLEQLEKQMRQFVEISPVAVVTDAVKDGE